MKHTPGPWKVETYHDSMFKIVRDLDAGMVPERRLEADARLIAAAPDLLEACIKLLKWHQYARDNGAFTMAGGDIYIDPEIARKAIAKATGSAE
jgi:hypothetical protein